jgi:hypothetical protein
MEQNQQTMMSQVGNTLSANNNQLQYNQMAGESELLKNNATLAPMIERETARLVQQSKLPLDQAFKAVTDQFARSFAEHDSRKTTAQVEAAEGMTEAGGGGGAPVTGRRTEKATSLEAVRANLSKTLNKVGIPS